MTRVILRAGLLGGATAAALAQLGQGESLVFWELLLLGVVVWELSRLPGDQSGGAPALFRFGGGAGAGLPRPVVASELTVIDAIAGHLEPERRLLPSLRHLAGYRLASRGIGLDTAEGRRFLGEESWQVIQGELPLDLDRLDRLLATLERL